MYGSLLTVAAAERLGYHPYPGPDRRPTRCPMTAVRRATTAASAAFFGCPIHAKGDPVALAAPGPAHRAGRGPTRLVRQPDPDCTTAEPSGSNGMDAAGPTSTRSGPTRWWWPAGRWRRRGCSCCRASSTPRSAGTSCSTSRRSVWADSLIGPTTTRAAPSPTSTTTTSSPDPESFEVAARRRAAVDQGRDGRARRSGPPDPRGQHLPLGDRAQGDDARVALSGTTSWRFVHAGRGPSPAHQPGRPRPHRSATSGASPWPGPPTSPTATRSSPRSTTPPSSRPS